MADAKQRQMPVASGMTGERQTAGHMTSGIAILIISVMSLGVLAGFGIASWRNQTVPVEELDPTALPASLQTYDGMQIVVTSFETSSPVDLLLNGSGTVTGVAIQQGTMITDGMVVAWVDSSPVVAMTTSIPLYRDLGVGDSGPDVSALEQELITLGYFSEAVDGYFGFGLRDAIRAMKRDLQFVDTQDGSFSTQWYVWLPTAPFAVDRVGVVTGKGVEAGNVVATQEGKLSRVDFDLGADLASVGRPLSAELFGTVASIQDSSIKDPATLAELSKSSEYIHLSMMPEGLDGYTSRVRYQDPVQLLRVPPVALFSVNAKAACLASNGQTHSVVIVTSSLGGTLVDSQGWTPSTVDVGSALDGLQCPA